MIRSRVSSMALVAALLSPLGCGVGTDPTETGVEAESLTGPTAVANMSPSGIVESTGNLYWTRNYSTIFPRKYVAQVYRAAKTNVPGQETILYQESSGSPFSFDNITFAMVNGVWYGYFVAYYRLGGTQIKRVPLDGSSPAVTLGNASTTLSAGSPLLTDGSHLFYYGPDGLYAMTMDGLNGYRLSSATNVSALGIDSQHLYWAEGTNVYRALKPPYTPYTTLIATTTDPVTQMSVLPGSPDDNTTTVYYASGQYVSQWSQTNGAALFTGAYGFGLVNPVTATSLSVSSGGSNVVWTWCDATPRCWVGYRGENDFIGFGTITSVAVGARQAVGDATRIFYVDNSAFERFSY
jgi:hypothetical protein